MSNYNEEPKVSDVLYQICLKDGYKEILSDYTKLQHFLYFMEKEQIPSIIDKVKTIKEDEYENLVENIVQLSPFSRNFILELMDSFGKKDITSNILRAYQVMDSEMEEKRIQLNHSILRNSGTERIEEFKKSIVEYEKQKDKNQLKLEELTKLGSSEKKLANEVLNLQKEIQDLEKSYTKEALENQKKELEIKQKELSRNKDEYVKNQQYLQEIKQEIENGKSTTKIYKKAMSALNELAKQLPNGEE